VELSRQDRETLAHAKLVLEHPDLTAKLGQLIGTPIEFGISRLPDSVQRAIAKATQVSLEVGLRVALATLDERAPTNPRLHKLMGGLAGAAGGFFGLLALPAELPVSTLIILRAIADVARAEGEDLNRVESQLACLSVFALGGGQRDSGAAETGYYATRVGLSQALTHAAEHVARHGIAKKAAPPVADLLTRIAARFSFTVSEEVLAKAVPIVGAASGAAINALFVHHFQEVSRAHFSIRRLERVYGAELVRQAYERLSWHAMGFGSGDEDTPVARA
jgi:hypothetical protein